MEAAARIEVVKLRAHGRWTELSVQPLVFRLVCSSGLIAADRSLRKTHVGRALGKTTPCTPTTRPSS